MKKINIIKIYDASNAGEAEHLIEKQVLFSSNLKCLYNLKISGIYNGLIETCKCQPSKFSVSKLRTQWPDNVDYIAEFEEVEEDE